MEDPSCFEVKEQPYPIPAEYRQGTAREEYVKLLQKTRDAAIELVEERERRAAAEDSSWVRIVDALHERDLSLRRALDAHGKSECWEALAAEVRLFLENMEALWSEQEILVVDATGAKLGDLAAGAFETVGTRPPRLREEDLLVVETWRPAIYRRGNLIRAGQVVIARS